MSLATTIRVDAEKFFKGTETEAEKFAAAFLKDFKKSPLVVQSVQNFVNSAAPVITAAVDLADPLAEPAAAAALVVVETSLAAIQASLTAANSGQSLAVNLQNFANTVPQLLSGIAVKNPILAGTIVRIVNLVTGEAKVLIPAVQGWVEQIKPPMTPASQAA